MEGSWKNRRLARCLHIPDDGMTEIDRCTTMLAACAYRDAPNNDVPPGINIWNCPDASGNDPCANTWNNAATAVSPRGIATWYGASLVGAAGTVVVADVAAGAEGSLLFGRGYYGWTGYLNGNAPWGAVLRIGFGWNGARPVFRVSCNLINSISSTGHIDLWPPSVW